MERNEILDFTAQEEEELGVRLSKGIELNSLKAGEAFILEPNIEKDFMDRGDAERKDTYYSRSSDNVDNLRTSIIRDFDITEEWSDLKEKMTALTADGGVLKWTKRNGKNDIKLPNKASITCYYEMLVEGQDEPFDSSIIRGRPERFKLDSDQILPGIEILLKTMTVGETAIAIISPNYAFGRQGVPPRIPPATEIMAEVQLINFTEEGEAERILALTPDARALVPLEEIKTAAEKEHRSGNVYFQSGEWRLALQSYSSAHKLLEQRSKEEKDRKEMRELFITLYLNKAACFLNLEMGPKAVDQCTKVLVFDELNVKAYYRRGKAYIMSKKYDLAKENLVRAARLAPKDRDIEKELVKLNKIIKNLKEQELSYSRKMFADVEQLPEKKDYNVLNSSVYKELVKFKEDPDAKEITLPTVFLNKEKAMLRRATAYLNLNLRISDIQGLGEQKIVITKKQK